MTSDKLTLFFVWCWFEHVRQFDSRKARQLRYRQSHIATEEQRRQQRVRSRAYYCRNRELAISREVERNRGPKRKIYIRNWARKQRASRPEFRILQALRTRVGEAVSGKTRAAARTIELVGCSLPDLRQHLEAQFSTGMTLENYGAWHVDHKCPCAAFDLTDPEQQRRCFHYSNLQPLWARDNLKKGARL